MEISWIDVNEQKPDIDRVVLCACVDNENYADAVAYAQWVEVGFYSCGAWWSNRGTAEKPIILFVTHWMEQPALPRL